MTPSGISERSRERQARALQAAEELTGQSRTQLAAAIGLGYDQYGRYLNGTTPLRVEQIEEFAIVYGVDVDVLGLAILTGDTSTLTTYDIRAALRVIGETDAEALEEFATEWEGREIKDQRAAVASYQRQMQQSQRRTRPA